MRAGHNQAAMFATQQSTIQIQMEKSNENALCAMLPFFSIQRLKRVIGTAATTVDSLACSQVRSVHERVHSSWEMVD